MLLEIDVISEPYADETKDLECRGDGELDGVSPDLCMLDKGAQIAGWWRKLLGERRQQDLLLETEMLLFLGLPVGQKHPRNVGPRSSVPRRKRSASTSD